MGNYLLHSQKRERLFIGVDSLENSREHMILKKT